MTNHYAEAKAWLKCAENAYKTFEADTWPRDLSLLRKAELATSLAVAHAQVGAIAPRYAVLEDAQDFVPGGPVGPLIPVSPAFAPEVRERH